MVNWATATHKEICNDMSRMLMQLVDENLSQNDSMSYYMPESTYRFLMLERRMNKVRKGPGKGRNRIVHVMRRG